ncbi:MAG: hypothetical protein JJU29_09920 [Verrucomicrobia bacterium]|nr:hypothetical protein [Verrucomicrobiota bacterium]MCH8511608.1 hypothetical protein [Kiritimatiellia bacterium]
MQDLKTSSETREPESLLQGINRSIFTKALIVSTVIHVVVLGGTSFALYRDWAEYGIRSEKYGFHTPSTLKTLQRDQAKEAEEAERTAREEARRDEQRARAMEEAEREPEERPRTTRPDGPPEEPTIEPLPPRSFSLDDVLDL